VETKQCLRLHCNSLACKVLSCLCRQTERERAGTEAPSERRDTAAEVWSEQKHWGEDAARSLTLLVWLPAPPRISNANALVVSLHHCKQESRQPRRKKSKHATETTDPFQGKQKKSFPTPISSGNDSSSNAVAIGLSRADSRADKIMA
jgi:hypothetical protein